MPRERTTTDVLRVQVRGAGRAARSFSRAQRQLQDELIDAMRALEREINVVLGDHAPEDTRDTIESIRSRFWWRAVRPRFTVQAGAPGHGGDPAPYVNVPRFGHRVARIHPVRARALKIHYMGHRNPHVFVFRMWATGVGHPPQQAVLAQSRAGRSLRTLRRAYQPADWVRDAQPEVDRLVEQAASRLGRRIDATVLRVDMP